MGQASPGCCGWVLPQPRSGGGGTAKDEIREKAEGHSFSKNLSEGNEWGASQTKIFMSLQVVEESGKTSLILPYVK